MSLPSASFFEACFHLSSPSFLNAFVAESFDSAMSPYLSVRSMSPSFSFFQTKGKAEGKSKAKDKGKKGKKGKKGQQLEEKDLDPDEAAVGEKTSRLLLVLSPFVLR